MCRSMRFYALRLSLVAGAALAAGIATAQSHSSFLQTDGIYGVHVVKANLTYTVSMDPGAYLIYNGNQYDLTNTFGFWTLSSNSPLNASGSAQNNWGWSESSAGGYIAGWHNPSKSDAILPNQQLSFTYATLDDQNVEQYGFHFSTVQTINGANTAYFAGPLNPVPEPATMAALGIGALALVRRRKSRV